MVIGVPRELVPGEDRVALVPGSVAPLIKSGARVLVEQGAGVRAGCPDDAYVAAGATLGSRDQVFAQADIVLQVRIGGRGGRARGRRRRTAELQAHRDRRLPTRSATPEAAQAMAGRGATVISMELIPRITRAQSMDALSSMANIAGYKAVLLAAATLPRMFPMMMTAAGTIAPARVFVIGAGVAGLQAIATAKRLGARIEAYDVRAAVKEQIESLGAKFVELPLDTAAAEGQGGYAAAQDESFYRRQRETMARVVAHSDVVITTAAIPGQEVAGADHRRHGRVDAARVGHRRPGRRARRQLRTDGRRPDHRGARRDHPRPDEPAGHRAVPRQPAVRQEPHDAARAPAQQAGQIS